MIGAYYHKSLANVDKTTALMMFRLPYSDSFIITIVVNVIKLCGFTMK